MGMRRGPERPLRVRQRSERHTGSARVRSDLATRRHGAPPAAHLVPESDGGLCPPGSAGSPGHSARVLAASIQAWRGAPEKSSTLASRFLAPVTARSLGPGREGCPQDC